MIWYHIISYLQLCQSSWVVLQQLQDMLCVDQPGCDSWELASSGFFVPSGNSGVWMKGR